MSQKDALAGKPKKQAGSPHHKKGGRDARPPTLAGKPPVAQGAAHGTVGKAGRGQDLDDFRLVVRYD